MKLHVKKGLLMSFFVLVVFNGCISSILYHPDKKIHQTPESINLRFVEYNYYTESGNRNNSWWIGAEKSKYTVLFCHGNGGNISHRLKTVQILNEMNLNVFIFDYSGYGKSDGSPSEKETRRDAEAAWNFLVKRMKVKPEKIIVWGRSLGGAVAIRLAGGKSFAGLIVESSFSSLEKIVSDHAGCLFKPFGTGGKYISIEEIEKVKVPVCIIHSRDDEVIPYYHGEMLYRAAHGKKKFITISGSHNRGFYKSLDWYKTNVLEFINFLKNN